MIITRDAVKRLLQITGTEYDDIIDYHIPLVEQNICDYCRHDFVLTDRGVGVECFPSYYLSSSDFYFENSTNSINNANKVLTDLKFKVGDTVRIYSSYYNDGAYTISSISTNQIVFDAINGVSDEDADSKSIAIAKVVYPRSIMLVIAQMINYNIKQTIDYNPNADSLKLDDYTISFKDSNLNEFGYPSELMKPLDSFRVVYPITYYNRL